MFPIGRRILQAIRQIISLVPVSHFSTREFVKYKEWDDIVPPPHTHTVALLSRLGERKMAGLESLSKVFGPNKQGLEPKNLIVLKDQGFGPSKGLEPRSTQSVSDHYSILAF